MRPHFYRFVLLGAIGLVISTAMMVAADPPQGKTGDKPANGTEVPGSKERSQPVIAPGDVNLEFSRVYIHVKKSGVVGHEHAVQGNIKNGAIHFKETGSGRVIFDMTSFDADTDTARQIIGLKSEIDSSTKKKVNENMLGSEVLDVKKYPEAVFEITAISNRNSMSSRKLPEYLIQGEFTLHGKTNPIEVRADLEDKNGWLHLRGGFKILQSDYGIKPFSKMLGTVGVADELTILGDFWIAP